MTTQAVIARCAGVDISTVNKILNKRPGAVFRKETVRKVFKLAKDLKYDLGKLKHHHQRKDPRKGVDLPLASEGNHP